MIFEQGVELVKANSDSPKWTPMPENEFFQGTKMMMVQVCEGYSIYVDHPYSQYVETALEYAILMAELGDQAFRMAESGIRVFNAVEPRGID